MKVDLITLFGKGIIMSEDYIDKSILADPRMLAEYCIEQLKGSSEKMIAIFIDHIINSVFNKNHTRIFWGDRLLTLDKSMGFLNDEQFLKTFKKIYGNHQYDQYDSAHTISWRLHTLVWAAQNALALEGDFIECGVFKGDFSFFVVELIDFGNQPKTFYLFDTFDGFSAEFSSAQDYPDSPGFLSMANDVYKNPEIYEEVIKKFKNYPNVKIVKGAIPYSLENNIPEKIAFLHIDLNSPAAETAALNILFERVVKNGIIIFDDYGWYLFRKQKEAADSFMKIHGYSILELPTGQGLVIKR